jgi:hypothetical protein
LQVFVGRFFGNQQGKHQVDRLPIKGVEIDGLGQADEGAARAIHPGHTRMRQRDTAGQSCTTQTLALEQALENTFGQLAVFRGEQVCTAFKNPLFAGGVVLDEDGLLVEDAADQHGTR